MSIALARLTQAAARHDLDARDGQVSRKLQHLH